MSWSWRTGLVLGKKRPHVASPGYAAAIAAEVRSPGPPEDHLFGDWWAVDLVAHLNGPHGEPHRRAVCGSRTSDT